MIRNSANVFDGCRDTLSEMSASGTQRPFQALFEQLFGEPHLRIVREANSLGALGGSAFSAHNSEPPESARHTTGPELFHNTDLRTRLASALDILPQEERAVVAAYLYTPNWDAIAVQLGISRGKAESLFWSALGSLRAVDNAAGQKPRHTLSLVTLASDDLRDCSDSPASDLDDSTVSDEAA